MSVPGCLGAKSVHKLCVERQFCSLMNLNLEPVELSGGTCIGTVHDCDIKEFDDGSTSGSKPDNDDDLDSKIIRVEPIVLGLNLDPAKRVRIVALLVHHYDCFQWDKDTIGRTTFVEHVIDTGSARPITQRQYPSPTVAQESLRNQVKDMLQ